MRSISKRVREKSVVYACAKVQNPFSERRGSLVVMKAPIMIIRRGTDARRVNSPIRIRKAQTISNVPVK